MQNNDLDCTVVILSFNNADIIDECLRCTEEAASESEKKHKNKIKITVIDNGSSDKSPEIIREKHPKVNLIALKENIGVTKGNNLGMKSADTPYILLLNSDTFLDKNTLDLAFSYFKSNSKCDVLCVKVRFGDGSFQPFTGYLPNPLRTCLWSLGVESLPFIRNIIYPFYQYKKSFYDKEQKLGWAATCFFLLKKEVYSKTGGLDENIFVHMEDVEWCKRINDMGYNICYTPNITAIHLGGKSTKKFTKGVLLSQHMSGLKNYHLKHHPSTWFIVKSGLKAGFIIRSCFYFVTGNTDSAKTYFKAAVSVF